MFVMGDDWGIRAANQPINTRVTLSQSQTWVKNASAHGVPLSFDMQMWEDQTTAPAAMNVLTGLKSAFRTVAIHNNTGKVAPIPDFAIHPVPGGLEVSFPKGGRYRAELTSVNGKAVTLCEGYGVKAFVGTRRLAKGVYALRLQSASGAQSARIVVQ
jgi:hypothetical protein